MISNIKGIIYLKIIILIFFSFYIFLNFPENIAALKQLTEPRPKISDSLLTQYASNDPVERNKAKNSIVEIVLGNLQYDKWKGFEDYIHMLLYIENVLPDESPQLIIALNLSKDIGVVAVFNKVSDYYIFCNKIENIAPVNEIKFLPEASYPYKIMAIYQTIDEKLGSFFYEKFLQVYLYSTEGFKKVWQKSLYYEEIYKETWVNPQADDSLWNKVIKKTSIEYILGKPLRINASVSFKKYSAQSKEFPAKKLFSLVYSDDYRHSYYWSSRYNTFILGEVGKEVFLTDAALLEDMHARIETLYGFGSQNYKVLTLKGEIIYLPKNQFRAVFQNKLYNNAAK